MNLPAKGWTLSQSGHATYTDDLTRPPRSCFTARFAPFAGETDFERALRAMGITHIPSSPGHPQTCGKLERSHQTTKRWLAAAGPAATPADLQAQLDQWRHHYNQQRPHRAARGGTPQQRWNAADRAAPAGPITRSQTTLHHVAANGTIGWRRYVIGLDSALADGNVLVVARDDHLTIHGRTGIIRTLTIDPTRRYQPSGRPRGGRARLSAMSR